MSNATIKRIGNQYQLHGGMIHPFKMTLNGNRYIMPGWYKLSENEAMPNIEDIEFHPFKAKEPILPNKLNLKSNKVYKVESSKGGTFYEVTMNRSGSLECSCVGFGYRRKCRHVTDLTLTSQ
jgi:hypothetical protein|tara:strand:- start:258 stop:623 length:366 start_codon:yes stop_codon:yes gene_type:complete